MQYLNLMEYKNFRDMIVSLDTIMDGKKIRKWRKIKIKILNIPFFRDKTNCRFLLPV